MEKVDKVEEVKRQGPRSTARLRLLRCGIFNLLFLVSFPSVNKKDLAEASRLSALPARVECVGEPIARVWLVGIAVSGCGTCQSATGMGKYCTGTRAKVVLDDNPQLLPGSQPWALQGVPDSSTVMDSSTVICG